MDVTTGNGETAAEVEDTKGPVDASQDLRGAGVSMDFAIRELLGLRARIGERIDLLAKVSEGLPLGHTSGDFAKRISTDDLQVTAALLRTVARYGEIIEIQANSMVSNLRATYPHLVKSEGISRDLADNRINRVLLEARDAVDKNVKRARGF